MGNIDISMEYIELCVVVVFLCFFYHIDFFLSIKQNTFDDATN